jgi:hypothetical protein
VAVPSNAGKTVNTFTPTVVTTDETSPFDTSQGTVFLTLGGGGTNTQDNTYGTTAKVATFTQIRTGTKPTADSTEPAAWSAMTDTTDSYGIAYFAVDPGQKNTDKTTITVTYLHAPTQTSGAANYSEFDSFQLIRDRSDAPQAQAPEFPMPAVAVGATAALAGGLLYQQHRRSTRPEAAPVPPAH